MHMAHNMTLILVQEPVPTVQVNLGDIPGRLVDLGRPPLPAGAKALAAAAQDLQQGPQSPKDSTVMEHRVAGDLVLGKMNRSLRKSMARTKVKRRSEGSVRSRKSIANSDLAVSVLRTMLPYFVDGVALASVLHKHHCRTAWPGHVLKRISGLSVFSIACCACARLALSR